MLSGCLCYVTMSAVFDGVCKLLCTNFLVECYGAVLWCGCSSIGEIMNSLP